MNQSWKKMENSSSVKSDSKSKERALTPVRIFRGVLCLIVFVSTAFMFLVYFSPVAFTLRFFSIHCSRKTSSFLFGLWLALWPFLFEVVNGTKVVFYGDIVPPRERVLLMANHKTEVDWMYLWDLALRKGCLGYIKYILKSSLMNLPLFGWGFHILEFIPVERKWEIDEPILWQVLSTFSDRRDPLWLAVFPEGTDYTEEKCKRSREFAIKNGLPVMENILLPKTRGFCACLGALRASLDAVYDVTIAYKHQCPSFLDNVFGVGPSEVHLHVRRIPIAEIPTSDNDASGWLMEKFQVKDELLSNFKARGHFPEPGGEDRLSAFMCSLNFGLVISLTALFSYLTLFSSYWFKIYVGLSCAYLSFSTYFNVMPQPVLGFIKGFPDSKKQSRD